MAITDAGKLFESESVTDPKAHTLGAACKAGSLIAIALAGTRSGANLDLTGIIDSQGNTWDWRTYPSTNGFCGVAWCRIPVPMTTTDTITINWNGTPVKAWVSAHNFEGAAGVPTHEATATGDGATWGVTLTVTGSDWLTFASMNLPYEFDVVSTPINSSISQDTRDSGGAGGNAPWCEAFSRNGTTGTTHTIGSSGASVPFRIVGVSFPFEALPIGRSSQPFFMGW